MAENKKPLKRDTAALAPNDIVITEIQDTQYKTPIHHGYKWVDAANGVICYTYRENISCLKVENPK